MQWITQPTTQPGNDASSTMDGRRKILSTPRNRTFDNFVARRYRNVRQLLLDDVPGDPTRSWTFRQYGQNPPQPWVPNTHRRKQRRPSSMDTTDANPCQTWMLAGRMETLHIAGTARHGRDQGRHVSKMKRMKKKRGCLRRMTGSETEEEEEDLADLACKIK